MSRGIVCSSEGQRIFDNHRILLDKKAPFQKIDENYFIHAPSLKWQLDADLIQKLIDLKKQKSVRSKYGQLILSVFFILVFGLFAITFS